MLVVPTDEELPAKLEPLREYNGDKLVVALDPDAGALPLELRLPHRACAGADEALGRRRHRRRAPSAPPVERALAALSDERKIKNQLTGAKTSIDKAYGLVEEMAARVRGLLQEIDALVRPADECPRRSPAVTTSCEL